MSRMGALPTRARAQGGVCNSIGQFASVRKTAKAFLLASTAALASTGLANAKDLDGKSIDEGSRIDTWGWYGTGPWSGSPDSNVRFKTFGNAFAQFGVNAWLGPNIGGQGNVLSFNTGSQNTFRTGIVGGVDLRAVTGLGEVRSYFRGTAEASVVEDGSQLAFYANRGFFQAGGFTFGLAKSFFDMSVSDDPASPPLYASNMGSYQGKLDTGSMVAAYTSQFGGGFSVTIGLEQGRRTAVLDAGADPLNAGYMPGPKTWFDVYGGTCTGSWALVAASPNKCENGDYRSFTQQAPNPFAAFKVSQAWGRWDASVTGQQIRTGYYGVNSPTSFSGPAGYTGVHPSDVWGWAVASGIIINVPWQSGDQFWVNGVYTQGATGYLGLPYDVFTRFGSGNTIGLGWGLDGVFKNDIPLGTPTTSGQVGNPTGIQLTAAWTVGSGFQHWWSPQFSTTLFGSVSQFQFNDRAKDMICGAAGVTPGPGAACNPGFSYFTVGTHTDWYPVPSLRLGVEILYTKIDTAFDGAQINVPQTGTRPPGIYTARDQGITSVTFRAQRQWPAGGG